MSLHAYYSGWKTHNARHTFATTITLSNGVPIETVSQMLGHTKLFTTQIYAKVLDTKASQDMKALRSIFANKEKTSENQDSVIRKIN